MIYSEITQSEGPNLDKTFPVTYSSEACTGAVLVLNLYIQPGESPDFDLDRQQHFHYA